MLRDIAQAARALGQAPLLAVAAVLILGLGIGGSTVAFTAVEAVLLRPLPFDAPERLVRILDASSGGTERGISLEVLEDWSARATAFEHITVYRPPQDASVLLVQGRASHARVTEVSPNLTTTLGVSPLVGRDLGRAASLPITGYGGEVLLSHDLWQEAFGGSPDAIGQTVSLEGGPPSTVAGIMPPGFAFPADTNVWLSLDVPARARARPTARGYEAVARLRSGTDTYGARTELERLAAESASALPDTVERVHVVPLLESIVGAYRTVLVVIYLAVASVLLIGCANVAHLLLARAVIRRRELAVRAALGATRWQLARQLFAEAMILAALGGLAGWALAHLLWPVLVTAGGSHVPRLAAGGLDWLALIYCASAAMSAAVVAGVLPACLEWHADLRAVLAGGEGRGLARRQSRFQALVTGGQIAICLVLLSAATVLAQAFVRLTRIELGFSPRGVVSVDLRAPIYTTVRERRWHALASTSETLRERLGALPGVFSVALTTTVPLASQAPTVSVTDPGRGLTLDAVVRQVSPRFFQTLGIPLLAGRDFTTSDRAGALQLVDPGAPTRDGVAIVNATLAARLWPDGNPLGQSITSGIDRVTTPRRRIVGVAADMRSGTLLGPPPAELYVPLAEEPSAAMILLLRTQRGEADIMPLVRRELQAVDPVLSAANVQPLQDIVTRASGLSVASTPLVAAFAVVGVLLAALGVYGVAAFHVATRRREIGVRQALGASSSDILGLCLSRALRPVILGGLAGMPAAWLVARFTRHLLPGISPAMPMDVLTAAGILLLVAAAATSVPVAGALRAGPAVSLRTD